MYDKWGDGTKMRKGYLKIHVVAVDIKTKEILALEVTDDEKVHDSRMMKELVKHVLKINPHKIKIRSVLADDGANGTNKNFIYLEKNKIVPGIKVIRSDSIVSSKNNKLRNKEVKMQSKDLLKWKKKKRKYGQRWMAAETVFSSIKKMFDKHISATQFQDIVKEMMIKVSLYNLFRRSV
ncbi:MAG: transposase, partial [Candidatus Nitrosocosmicus sp.]